MWPLNHPSTPPPTGHVVCTGGGGGTWTCMGGDSIPTGVELVVLPSQIAPDGWVGVDVDLGRGLRGLVVWMGHFGVYWQCLVLQYHGDGH